EVVDNTLNVSFKGLDRNKVSDILIANNILANIGATYLDSASSHVIKALCNDKNYISGSIRFSVGRNSTIEDIDKTITVLQENILPLYS
ncbi:MAG: hypothetical protein LBH40_00305, partial [Alphaproteobacteria bacterium]|nr:hypothetical protein [Alphaproteobacteria bacterium]